MNSKQLHAYNIEQVRIGNADAVRKSIREMSPLQRRLMYGQLTLDEIMDNIQITVEMTMHMETAEPKE